MFFVSSCNNLRDKPLLGTVRVPPPPPADKNWQSSKEISANGRGKKFTKCNHYRYWDLLLIFPFCKAVKLPQFQKGIISTSPLASVPASSDNLTRDLCGSLLLIEQLEAKSVLPDPDFMAGSGLWHCLVWPAVCFKQKKPLGASSGECCFSWV